MVKAYNSEKTLGRCLTSLHNQVDRILVADGWFPYNRPPGNASTDRTSNIAIGWPQVQWMPAPEKPYQTEMEKQNAMISMVLPGAWQLWLDTDEELVGNLREYVRQLDQDVDAIPIILRQKNGLETVFCRLVKTLPGMRMARNFHLQYNNHEPSMNLELGPLWKQVYIQHFGDATGMFPNV